MIGFDKALETIKEKAGEDFEIVEKLACSSAAGGLKMIAIGLVEELTAEAAKRAALGAGAKVIKTYNQKLNNLELEEIKNTNLDIILLAGGTDGGNEEVIIHNAEMLKNIDAPIVVAGNKSAVDKISKVLEGRDFYIAENVMPKINVLNVESARDTIREIFMTNIVKARGMQRVLEEISEIVMPTPAAVLKAAEVLSLGTEDEDGLGDIAVVDIGGATTDVHTACSGDPTKAGVYLRGLEEPFAKRTVEGDLGMRYSIEAAVEVAGKRMLKSYLGDKYEYDILEEASSRYLNPSFIAENERDLNYDTAVAKALTRISVTRHAGQTKEVYSPVGAIFQQTGKDLTELPVVIGTGGILVFNPNPIEILKEACFNMEEPESLKPKNPKFFLDKEYILSSMGLLSCLDKDMAVRMMKKYLVKLGE